MKEYDSKILTSIQSAIIQYLDKRFEGNHTAEEILPTYEVIMNSQQVSKALENIPAQDLYMRKALQNLLEEGTIGMRKPGKIISGSNLTELLEMKGEKIQMPIGFYFIGDSENIWRIHQESIRKENQ